MPIPKSVDHAELQQALKPLYDFLGTSGHNIYDDPGIIIGPDAIMFNVPSTHEDDPTGRVDGVPAERHPQGPVRVERAELVHYVRVEIVR